MSRSDRLFEIIQMLRRAKKPWTADRLADALEVTPRTIYRDIAALQAMRVPVAGEAGVGYLMRPGFDLPPLMFSPDEAEAIVVGLALLQRTGDRGLQRAAQSVARKIADVVPKELTATFAQAPLHVSHYGAVSPAAFDLETLREAIRDERKLLISYRDGKGQETRRTVLPLAVFYYVEVIILAAWCEMREGFRHFRADRITAYSELEARFKGRGEKLRKRWREEHGIVE
jgi:predicted DNA-binding transcriptional regulator YafY